MSADPTTLEKLDQALVGVSGDAAATIAAAIAATVPDALDPTKVYSRVTPDGATGEVLDLDRYLPFPRRAIGVVQLQAVDDFARYVARHDDVDATTIWVDAESHWIVAVLNDHTAAAPEWGDHRAVLKLKATPEWLHWLSRDGQMLTQADFAEHIEDGLVEIVEPDGASMLEVAQSIQGTTTAQFKNAHRLQDGTIGVEYVEEQTAAAGRRGDLAIPERFVLAIAPFLGEETYRVEARLRYRIREGTLTLGYRLERPWLVLRDAVDQIADRLTQRFPGDRVFVGTPRS